MTREPMDAKLNASILHLCFTDREKVLRPPVGTRDINLLFKTMLQEHQQVHTRLLLVFRIESMITMTRAWMSILYSRYSAGLHDDLEMSSWMTRFG